MTKKQIHLRKNFVIDGVKLQGFSLHPGDYVLYKRKKYIIKAYGQNVKEYFLKDTKTGDIIQNVSEHLIQRDI